MATLTNYVVRTADGEGYATLCENCAKHGRMPEGTDLTHPIDGAIHPFDVCDECTAPDDGGALLPIDDDPHAPPPGSWAAVARAMAAGDDSGFDWDAWKESQKLGE